jgi:glycosyltransferase involved in cell wall biosynthesis
VTRLHLKHAYDVIHVHTMPDFLVFSAVLPKLLGAKVILHVQDISPELMGAKTKGPSRKLLVNLATWQERISTAFADHVISVGWTMEELLLKRGVPAHKITNILNSADPKLFPPSLRPLPPSDAAEENRPFIVMYYGTIAERSGLDTAIRALALAVRSVPQLRLEIKGRGEQIDALKQLAVKLGVSDHVEFLDSSPINEIVHFIVHGDVGIIPYPHDGFAELMLPTKAYELAWMHRPIIASDTRGIRSMFRPESIVLCDSTSPESFAEAIIDLYRHPEKRARMIANAAEDYEPFRWELMAERYQQLLASLSRKPLQERPMQEQHSMASRSS